MLFDGAGKSLGSAQRELSQRFPQPGWVEHDPAEIWESQLATAREVVRSTATATSDVACVGITNQRETTIVWERAGGRPVYPAIVWQDRRTAALCEDLAARGLGPIFRAKTGLVLDPYFSATKIAWILRNVEGAAARARAGELAFGTVNSWLIYKLSGGRAHLTDVSNAARTLLFNIHTLDWDDELLGLLEVPRALLPEVRPSAGAFATTETAAFGRPLPITGVAGDQQAALFGQACFSPGMAKNTYGTGAFVVMNTGARAIDGPGAIATVAWQLAGEAPEYALEGSIFVAGAAVQWLRDGLGIVASAGDIEALARSVPDSGGVYFVPALAGLGAPYWDPHARGTILGLTRGTTKAHLARATLEAIAFERATRSTRCKRSPACACASCASTAAPPSTACSYNFKPTCSTSPSCARGCAKRPPSARPRSPASERGFSIGRASNGAGAPTLASSRKTMPRCANAPMPAGGAPSNARSRGASVKRNGTHNRLRTGNRRAECRLLAYAYRTRRSRAGGDPVTKFEIEKEAEAARKVAGEVANAISRGEYQAGRHAGDIARLAEAVYKLAGCIFEMNRSEP